MTVSQFAILESRGVVGVGGSEARDFLQNVITTDMDRVAETGAGYGGLLTPQGKILFDFMVFKDGNCFLFDTAGATAGDFAKRLTFYRLRAKVEIVDLSTSHHVVVAWGSDAPFPGVTPMVPDPRLAMLGLRGVTAAPIAASNWVRATEADYRAHRLTLGVPEGGVDFAYGESFPHDADMDQLGGVDFKKGCYVGQEVVSRMEHRGTARRRIVPVNAAGALPDAGTAVTAGGKALGVLGSTSGSKGLAQLRLDRVQEARNAGTAILAGDVPIVVSIPSWARFGWPSPGGED